MKANNYSNKCFLRDVDLAARYSVSRNTVWRWTREGRLPQPIKLAPSCTRWPAEAIETHDQILIEGGV